MDQAKAIRSMASRTTDVISDLTEATTGTMANNLHDAVDMTASFLACTKSTKPSLPPAFCRVYRGIIRKPEGMPLPEQRDSVQMAVLGGSSAAVQEAIIFHHGISEALAHPELAERWTSSGYISVGLAVWDCNHCDDPEHFRSQLMELDSTLPQLLLLLFGNFGRWRAWELVNPNTNTASASTDIPADIPVFREVSISISENRKKDEQYYVSDIRLLGVSVSDQVNALVKSAICQQMQSSLSLARQWSQEEVQTMIEFAIHPVPADGMCFWHCLCALQDLLAWEAVPRKDSGYAIHPSHVKLEVAKARSLLESVMKHSVASCQQVQQRAHEIKQSPVVDVTDVPWIARLLKMRIRCTLQKQAGLLL